MRISDVLRRKYCACHEKMSPRHTKSCNCHAKWCQHSRSKFDDSFTKRAFRALQDRLQEHQILRLPRKMDIFHDFKFRATLTTVLHTSQNPHVLHISRFPKIDTARRRERTSEMDLVGAPFRAGEMQIFDLEGNFSPRGSPKKPDPSAHTTDLHQMLFPYRKNPIVWPHCLGNQTIGCVQRHRATPPRVGHPPLPSSCRRDSPETRSAEWHRNGRPIDLRVWWCYCWSPSVFERLLWVFTYKFFDMLMQERTPCAWWGGVGWADMLRKAARMKDQQPLWPKANKLLVGGDNFREAELTPEWNSSWSAWISECERNGALQSPLSWDVLRVRRHFKRPTMVSMVSTNRDVTRGPSTVIYHIIYCFWTLNFWMMTRSATLILMFLYTQVSIRMTCKTVRFNSWKIFTSGVATCKPCRISTKQVGVHYDWIAKLLNETRT